MSHRQDETVRSDRKSQRGGLVGCKLVAAAAKVLDEDVSGDDDSGAGLFVYEPGTSTKTATDSDWPAPQQPCTLQPRFEVPGAQPPAAGLRERAAQRVCQRVADDALHRDCEFDVATTGDESFARGYLLGLRLGGSVRRDP